MAASGARTTSAEPVGNTGTAALFDFDSSDSPIYLQLSTILRRQITLGMWPVDERIPTIDALAEQYGVANGTVRQALGFLEREGLIRRIRRRGTFVLRQPETPDAIVLPTSRQELSAFLEKLQETTEETTGGADDPDGLRVRRRRYFRDHVPVMLEHERASATLFASPEPALRLIGALGEPAPKLDQVITIGTADTETAELLDMPVNAAVALVRHTATRDDGALVLHSEWLVRGDLLNMVEHFSAHQDEKP